MKPVLIAFATTYGSTREVAERVAQVLSERGVSTTVRPARDVKRLDDVSAVVLGGALYFFRWHRQARKFVSRHRRALAGLPCAVFAMGPFNDKEDDFASARRHLDRSLARYDGFQPRSVAVFGGRFDPNGLKFPHSNPAMKQIPASDIRDWDAIQAWAESLPEALGLAASSPAAAAASAAGDA